MRLITIVGVHIHDDKLADQIGKFKCGRKKRTRAKAKAAQQGGPSPQPLDATGDGATPLTPAAGEATAGGPAQPAC